MSKYSNRNSEETLFGEWTSKGGFVISSWNNSNGLLLYRNSEGTLYGECTSKEGFAELPWNSSSGSLFKRKTRGGPPLSEEQRITPQLALRIEFSSWERVHIFLCLCYDICNCKYVLPLNY